MSKHKIICLALCGLMLTSCGNSGEDTAAETSAPETEQASESVSETAKTEAETVNETEAPESSETVPEETESTENFDKVKDRVIFVDGTQKLTAGQYIDALESCEEFDVSHPSFRDFQIMDMDGNGIPEIIVCGRFMAYTFSRLFTVSAEGKADAVPILNHNLCDSSDHSECYVLTGAEPSPYEKDGKTVWISNFSGGGTDGGFSGEYILRYDGSGIDGEVIDRAEYETYGQEDENGEWYRIRDDFYYIFGEEVTEEEYDSKKKEYFDGLQPSDALYVQSSMGSRENSEFTENLADALEKYLDMRDGAYKST